MADIDLKTETPDTTLPSTGFLFGADSQAAASPSVYSVPVAAAALLSNAPNGTAAAPSFAMGLTGLYTRAVTARLNFTINGFDTGVEIGPSVIALQNTASLSWVSGTLPSTAIDLTLTRKGAGNLRLGAADAASPVAQTLSVQGRTGTDVAATDYSFKIQGAQGTGTGAGGSIVFEIAPAGSAGSTPNGFTPFVEMTSTRALNVYNTFTDASNYERGFVRWNSNVFQVGHAAAGTGTTRNMALVSGSSSYAFNSNDIAIFPAAGGLEFSARARVSSPALGIIRLTENNGANAGSLELPEWAAAPAAPAANNVRIYAVDNGSGKTQLMALFATGAAQQIAIEP